MGLGADQRQEVPLGRGAGDRGLEHRDLRVQGPQDLGAIGCGEGGKGRIRKVPRILAWRPRLGAPERVYVERSSLDGCRERCPRHQHHSPGPRKQPE